MKWIVAAVILLSLVIAWLINMDYLFSSESSHSSEMTALQTTINQCTNIAEQAAAHLPEALPFQRMEKIGRQARVMRLCMADNGFAQSSDWTVYAAPIAETNAQSENISVDEAYENLRRQHMILISPAPNTPAYWAQSK